MMSMNSEEKSIYCLKVNTKKESTIMLLSVMCVININVTSSLNRTLPAHRFSIAASASQYGPLPVIAIFLLGKSVKNKFLFSLTAVKGQNDTFLPCQLGDLQPSGYWPNALTTRLPVLSTLISPGI